MNKKQMYDDKEPSTQAQLPFLSQSDQESPQKVSAFGMV
jgi:hypothetical protein